MKAIVYTEFGPPEVLQLKEVAKPVPKENEVLVRVRATPVNFGDLIARNFGNITARQFNMPALFLVFGRAQFGSRKPKVNILGSEFSGEVEAVGSAVTSFKKGDPVFGYPGMSMGAYAEYLCMPGDGRLALKPANLTYEQAAALPYGALTALSLLRKADIRPGWKVLVIGASGSIGAAALQLARHFGAQVTGVCATPRLEYVKSLGAHQVIDYTREDFTQNGETYDLIFDVLGRSSFARCKGSLTEKGIYLLASFKTKQLFQMLWTSITGGRRVLCAMSDDNPADMAVIRELAEAGRIKSTVDKSFPLEQTAEAHRYAESGLKKGPVVITVGGRS